MTDKLTALLDAFVRDARVVGLELHPNIADLGENVWIRASDEPVPADYGSSGFVLEIPEHHTQLVTEDSGVEREDIQYIASLLQDWVIEELWRPWPEIRIGDRESCILAPFANIDGDCFWSYRGRTIVKFGSLEEVFGR